MLVYSYVRFSSKKQELNDSLRRQTENGEKWIAKNGYQKASLTLHDLGVSGFRGKNRHEGALALFLAEVKEGRIKPGSILLVEALDRLSREGVGPAYALFTQILSAGVKIAVLIPQETIYTKESINDIAGLMAPLVAFQLAHNESKNKSKRTGDYWKNKRKEVASNGGLFDKKKPLWVDLTNGTFKLNQFAPAIKFIFEQTAKGIGQKLMTKTLNEKFPNRRWNGSFVQSVLVNRHALGERQPMQFTEEGKRVPVGEPIKKYYPAVIDESLWTRAANSKAIRFKAKGREAGFINLFKGLVINSVDCQPCHLTRAATPNGYTQHRLASRGHLEGLPGSCSLSVEYHSFEKAILRLFDEIDPKELCKGDDNGSTLHTLKTELSGIETRLGEITNSMADPNAPLATLNKVASQLEQKAKSLKKEINQLEAKVTADKPLTQFKTLKQTLTETTPEELPRLRLRLRHIIAELASRIFVRPEKHYGRIWFFAVVELRNGLQKSCIYGPGFPPIYQRLGNWSDLVYDPRDMVPDSRITLDGWAKMANKIVAVKDPGTTPTQLGEAVKLFVDLKRAATKPDSWRVLGPKIQKLVDWAGAKASFRSIDLAKFDEHLRLKTKAGEIAENSAKVCRNRAREFMRWWANRLGQKKIKAA